MCLKIVPITRSVVFDVAAADDRSDACEGGAVESPSGETAWSSLSAVEKDISECIKQNNVEP